MTSASQEPRLLVGLTGGLASGKSTVARWLDEAGCTVVDADRVVAELYAPGGAGARAVGELFGAEVLTEEGGVDHPALAAIVFSDNAARARLEAAIHPLVRRRFRELAEEAGGIVVLEATLLVEAGYPPDFDLVVSVEAPEDLRLERAVERGLSRGQARARLTAQGDGAQRRDGADRIVDNSGSLDQLRAAVDALLDDLRGQLARRAHDA
ncbi:MAG: dephospho-CoA kinase [Acidobacteriota bacterium]